jgi:hypothetical protein
MFSAILTATLAMGMLTAPVAAPGDPDPARERTGLHVVVDLDEHEVSLRDGRRILWSTPAGTGTGLLLETEDNSWEFSTPNGRFEVIYRELNPDWHRPDWYFERQGKRPPPRDHPDRRDPMALGHAAIFLGRGIAIHGTFRPDLLGRQVSHGCIRIPNEYAVRLFYAVRSGTPVYIDGYAEPLDELPEGLAVSERPEWDLLGEETTEELIEALHQGLHNPRTGEWTGPAARLVERSVRRGDTQAMAALLERSVQRFRNRAVATEYASFVVNVYDRRPDFFVAEADILPERVQRRVATMLVETSLNSFEGRLDRVAPWPSRAVANAIQGSPTFELIMDAERRYRSAHGADAVL